MVDYNKRLVEVDVLNHLSESDYNKIPEDVLQLIKDNMDKEYTWVFDESKPLKEQNVSRDTIAFLSYINMEYLLNDKQKEYMQKLHEINEQEKRKEEYSNDVKYDYSELFKRNNKTEDLGQITEKEQTSLVVYEEGFFTKMINKIKSFFRR
jgi:predicted transcriptional regulator